MAPPLTHFLSIPLVGAELGRNLARFTYEVTSTWGFSVPRQAIRPPGTLHLTLGVMSLEEDGIQKATELLQSLKLKDIWAQEKEADRSPKDENKPDEKGLSITLKGLQAMQDASATSVLYAPPVDPTGLLLRFCQRVKKAFQDAGLVEAEDRPLLLHATIINTIYIPRTRKRGRARERIRLDAREMVAQYDDFLWIEDMPVEKVALCKMGAKKIEETDDEAYEVVAEVGF